jgi:hypothetical protein
MLVAFVTSVIRTTAALYVAEPLPRSNDTSKARIVHHALPAVPGRRVS